MGIPNTGREAHEEIREYTKWYRIPTVQVLEQTKYGSYLPKNLCLQGHQIQQRKHIGPPQIFKKYKRAPYGV